MAVNENILTRVLYKTAATTTNLYYCLNTAIMSKSPVDFPKSKMLKGLVYLLK